MKILYSSLILTLALGTGFLGCGSSDSDDVIEENTPSTFTGRFIDSPVQGLRYVCNPSNLSGSTNNLGEYI